MMSDNSKAKSKFHPKHPSSDVCFIVDLDNVLFDASRLKKYLNLAMEDLVGEEGLSEFIDIWQKYYKKRSELRRHDFDKIFRDFSKKKNDPKLFRKVKGIYLEKDFSVFAQDGYKELILSLQSFGKVLLFTEGFLRFQKKKITALNLQQMIGKENIFLYPRKEKHIEELIKGIGKDSDTVVIEDKAKIIRKFRSQDSDIVGIWVRHGRHKNKKKDGPPRSQYEVSDIREIDEDLLAQVLN